MVSVGRGRGWAYNVETPLPRPGRTFSAKTNYADLVNIINLADVENSAQDDNEISKLVLAAAKKEDLQGMHEELYKHALMDREFGYKLLRIYTKPIIKKICNSENRSLTYYLMSSFQLDFERREKLREDNVTQFRNEIRLFSKYLKFAMTPDCKLPLLQSALLVYMEMLLETASADDIEIFTEQMAVHGVHFCTSYKDKVDNLMITARKVLLKEDLSVISRQMLLYAIDLQGRNFSSLPMDLQTFYKLQFGKENSYFISLNMESNSAEDKLNNCKKQSAPANNRRLRAIRGSEHTSLKSKLSDQEEHKSTPDEYPRLRVPLGLAADNTTK